jgi:ribosomal protein L11 methyltransferase
VHDVEPGWEERWREFHQPVRVGPLWVGPPWVDPPADGLAVTIEPARAFGTGAHPTTRLCLERLSAVERGSLLDVGCGSGVLAIGGARLGFAPVVAVDLDEQAVEATRANAAANGMTVDARLLDALAQPLPAADVVVANIAHAAIEELAPRLECRRLVASGYLETDAPPATGLAHVARSTLAGWACDLYERAAAE